MDQRPSDGRWDRPRSGPESETDRPQINRTEPRPPRPVESGPAGRPGAVPLGPGIGGGIPGSGATPDPLVGEEVLHAQRGPGTVEVAEDEVAERMDAESPDGRPPPLKQQREAKTFFWVALTVVAVAVIGVLLLYAGWLPALVAILLIGGYIAFAAWPTWHAAMDRKVDTDRVKREAAEDQPPVTHQRPGRSV